MTMDLEVQLRQAETRKAQLEKEHQEALTALRNSSGTDIDSKQSRVRELEKKVALETVRCEELQLELSSKSKSVNNSANTQSWGAKGTEIERIMAKIEQDNKILAELEHSRSTTLGTGLATSASSHALGESSPPVSPITMSHTTPAIYPSLSSSAPSGGTSTMAYIPPASGYPTISSGYNTLPTNYGKIGYGGMGMGGLNTLTSLAPSSLGALGAGTLAGTQFSSCPISNTTYSHPLVSSSYTQSYTNPALTNPSFSLSYNPATTYSNNVTFSNPLSAQFNNPLSGPVGMNIKLKPLEETDLGVRRTATPCTPHPPNWGLSGTLGLTDTRPMSRMLPDGLETDWSLHERFLNGHSTDGQVDMLDIPGKGRCSVYIARFSYEPEPETAEEELAVAAGDYLLVWGEPAGPGSYLDAELLDGRRGLVPSHFCTRLVGEDLLEFHQAVLSTLRDEEITTEATYVADLQRLSEMADLSEGQDDDQNEMPAPRQLTLERQLNKSVLIGWTAPETGPGNQIESYHVYVDGVLKTTVKATERTRALVEGVDSNRPHRISVRSVTANRRTSRDAACTMVIGKDTHMLGPTAVRASHVTSSQAVISWLPANSNHQHVVCVNNVEVRTVKPGVYRHTITGLAPNTQYRVTVRAKHLRAHNSNPVTGEEPPSPAAAHTDFRTLPKGLPDPPIDIQVEPGPQDGTLLVTWHPVQVQHHVGSSVTGYAVFADGKKVTDVDSPTGDHALIDISKLLGLNPKHVTVRTKSRDSQSADSVPTPIPNSVLRGGMKGRQQPHSAIPMHMRGQQQRPGQQVIEPDENLSDKEIFPSSVPQHRQGAQGGIPSIGMYTDNSQMGNTGRSTLRPVPEITKDVSSDQNLSEDDYLDSRRGRGPQSQQHFQGNPRQHQDQRQRNQPHQQYGLQGVQQGPQMNPRGQPMNQRGQNQIRQQGQPPTAQKRARWFVALFDYDPATMSPNPDACEEELPFSEGDTIKVWGDKDADGFYWGECRGRRGFVPHNMVMEVEGRDGNRDRWGDTYANMPVKRMVALYDYDPQELSPNVDAEVELSFTTGQIIHVYGEMDDDGFYMGELDGVRGLVPSNFLAEAPDQYQTGGAPNTAQGRVQARPAQRGHGPGARGPPPPPRDGRGQRNKSDACSPVLPCTQLDTQFNSTSHCTTTTVQSVQLQPNHTQQFTNAEHLQGRGRGVQQQPTQRLGGVGQQQLGGNQSGFMNNAVGGATTGGGMMSGIMGSMMGGTQQTQQRQQHKGVPTVIPTGISPLQQQQQQQQQHQQQQHQQQQQPTTSAAGPNLMQKFTEMTANAPGGDILSKGKELIFMKFGLGGGK